MKDTPVWLITGCSTGFGRDLAKLVLARGWRAVVTSRSEDGVRDIVAGHDTALGLALDVTKQAEVKTAVEAAETKFGGIDVLVNNAGYGYQSSVEEGEDAEIRAQFDANVFGLFALTRAVLPIMRRQRRGRIINVTSVAGLVGFPGSGYYAASKHAVEGWSDSLAAEVEPLGIKVTCVEPGPFRTDWAGRSLRQTPTRIADYEATAGMRLASTAEKSGTQAGDPTKAGEVMIEISKHPAPPRHLVLGAWGVDVVANRMDARKREFDEWRALGASTDYAE